MPSLILLFLLSVVTIHTLSGHVEFVVVILHAVIS